MSPTVRTFPAWGKSYDISMTGIHAAPRLTAVGEERQEAQHIEGWPTLQYFFSVWSKNRVQLRVSQRTTDVRSEAS